MQDPHTPRDGFADRLEWQISSELRRRHRTGPATWLPASPLKAAAAIAFLVIVSMAAGGAAVAAAVQAQNKERRDLVVSGYEQRVQLAQLRVSEAMREADRVDRQVAVGLERPDRLQHSRLKLAEAQALLKTSELELQEARATGREPLDQISAPLVAGRDFVTERLQASLLAPELGLANSRVVAQAMRRRMDVGLATVTDMAEAEARVLELEAAVASIRRKLEIRRQFVGGQIPAPQADLRVIESEAEQRVKALEPRIALARRHVTEAERRFQVGVATHVDLAEAKLRLLTLETDLAKAQLDLALIRKKIEEL
jgi:Outer membrane efflux protein